MKLSNKISLLIGFFAAVACVSCDDTKSYAELLTEEGQAVNLFLVNQHVCAQVPADTVFEVGPNAPYYQIDDEGNVFMQVLNTGTKGNRATYDQLIYFRFTRYNLFSYSYDLSKKGQPGYYGDFGSSEGNDADLTFGSASFRYDNLYASNSYQWGQGLQLPLRFLPIDCEVNIVVRSQLGMYSEISQVNPFLYHVRYFKSQI